MTREDIDRCLSAIEEPKRTTLQTLRDSILQIVPEAEECISYGMPAFKVQGKTVAGFAAYKNHLSYMPHSGSVLATLSDETASYETSKGALKFAMDKPRRSRCRCSRTRFRQGWSMTPPSTARTWPVMNPFVMRWR